MNVVVAWTVLGMLCYGVAEYWSKRYAMKPGASVYIYALLFYLGTSIAWMPLIKHTNTLAVTSTIWNIGYFIISIALGLLIFGEKLTGTQVAGLVFGAIAIILLSIEG